MADAEVFLAIGADLSADPAGWSFTDVTAVIRENRKIRIDRGRRGKRGPIQATRVQATADNTDGNLARHNPAGIYYGLLNKNTPMRVDIDGVTRATVYTVGFPPSWDPSEQDQTVTLTGVGILDRLGRDRVQRPPMHATILGSRPLGFWPLDDPAGSSSAASAVPGVASLSQNAPANWAATDGVAGSSTKLVDLTDSSLAGPLQPNTGSGWALEFLVYPTSTATDGYMMSLVTDTARFNVVPDFSGVPMGVEIVASGSTAIYAPSADPTWTDRWHHFVIKCLQGVGEIEIEIWHDGILVKADTTSLVTDPGRPQLPMVNPYHGSVTITRLASSFGCAAVFGDPDLVDAEGHYWASLAYVGELAHNRIARLCAENGIRLQSAATASLPTGPQATGNAISGMLAAADADGGVLAESTDWGLLYLSGPERVNITAPAIELNYTAGHIAPPWEPSDDQQQYVNDVTASRSGGATVRVADEEAIALIGAYDTALRPNVETDQQLTDYAGQQLRLGAIDELTWPDMRINILGAPSLLADWLTTGTGSELWVVNHPTPLAPDTIKQIIEGSTETYGSVSVDITAILSPAGPYTVAVVEDDILGRADTEGMELLTSITSSATSMTAVTTSGPVATDDAGEYPVDLRLSPDGRLSGEVVTATAVANSLNDGFDRTVAAGSWGNTDTGPAWTITSGTAAGYSVASSFGRISMGTRALNYTVLTDSGLDDTYLDLRIAIRPAVVATVSDFRVAIEARSTGANDWCRWDVEFRPSGVIAARHRRSIGGAQTNYDYHIPSWTYSASQTIWARLRLLGDDMWGRVWPTNLADEPNIWQSIQIGAAAGVPAPGDIGVRAFIETSNTNALPVLVEIDSFRQLNPQIFTVTRGVNDVTRAWTAGTTVALAAGAKPAY